MAHLYNKTSITDTYSPQFLDSLRKALSPPIAQRYNSAEQWLSIIQKHPPLAIQKITPVPKQLIYYVLFALLSLPLFIFIYLTLGQ